ncbi:uncharacterized protein LOC119730016 [Patiria miniata]|uniref:YqaJ viral recombinase domain-containing protein n=1 Tax=Patiria miniata TaxID=46514 RepID=A0A914A4T8_PATMI|nr:uncharacterized protein LOC119730016 [Patiria miniata]
MNLEVTDEELWGCVRQFDVKTLQEFLSKVDVPKSGSKDCLQKRLFYALKLGLPIVPTASNEELSRRESRERKLRFGEQFKLPHPLTLDGWEGTSANLPPITEEKVNHYFRTRNKELEISTDGSKSLGQGRSMAVSRGRVHTVEHHHISDIGSATFEDWLYHKQEFMSSHKWLSGLCKHVAALLSFVTQQVECGSSESCTSQLQQWHRPSSSNLNQKLKTSAFLKDIKTPKVSSSMCDNRKGRRDMFDPRAVVNKKVRKLCDYDLDSLADISNGKAAVLLYAAHQRHVHPTLTSKPDINHLNSTLDEDISSSSPIRVSSVVDAFREVKKSAGTDAATYTAMTKEMACSGRSREWLAESTCQQAESHMWHKHRVGRITASNMGAVTKHVDESGNLTGSTHSIIATVMSYYKDFVSPATTYGKKHEAVAKSKYLMKMRRTHRHFNLEKIGLCISSSHPFIAASPDGYVNCKCCGAGLVEVKCPFKDKSLTVTQYASKGKTCLTVDEDKVSLRTTHNYYAQVQCQLFCTDRKYCDFVLMTEAKEDSMLIQRVYRNDEIINQMKHKASSFWANAVLSELETGAVEKKIALKYKEMQTEP